jgi:hypothetical protein
MSPRVLLAVVCLVAGVMLAAWSLAAGHLLLALVGFALAKAGKPKQPLKKAANAAWSMKDAASDGNDVKGPP